jgi:tetratricopeptide (TPR) repeat protein/CHAT domain-containing protein
MNEQRQQAYLNLIEELLNCHEGQELEILQANSLLVDKKLLTLMELVAADMAEKTEANATNWLRSVSKQLAEAIEQWEQLNQRVVELYHTGEYRQAVKIALESIEIAQHLWGSKHTNVADSLHNLATLYEVQGDYSQAELLVQAWNMKKMLLGNKHYDVATSLKHLADIYEAQGRYSEAEEKYREALAIKYLLVKEDPDVATNLNNLGYLYDSQGRYYEAEQKYREALEIRKRLLGQEHLDVARTLNNLAYLYTHQGRYSEAEKKYREALEIKKRLPGNEKHIDVATTLNNLALLYCLQGRYFAAEEQYLNVLLILKESVGEEHPYLARSLDGLAGVYKSQGRYSEAEQKYLEALEMTKCLFGEEHRELADSLNNIATLYYLQGRYSEAEQKYLEALEMREKILGKYHPDVASSLSNLGSLYEDQGRYSEGQQKHLEALEIKKRLLGEEHPDVARGLNNLAAVYSSQGRYSDAETMLLQSLAIKKRLVGEEHPDVARGLNNLAVVYSSQEHYLKAEQKYLAALAMRKRLLGDEHPDVASTLSNLAILYMAQGLYCEAESIVVQALEMKKRILGKEHPDVADSLSDLGILLAAGNRAPEALSQMLEANEIYDTMIRRVFAFSSENDRLAYLQKVRVDLDVFLSLTYNHLSDSFVAVLAALDLVLKRKALTASALAAQNYALYSGRYPHLTEDFRKLLDLSKHLVHLTFSLPQDENFTSYQQTLAQLQADHKKLQKFLASQVPEIKLQEHLLDHSKVSEALPKGSTLVEFVCFNVFNFRAVPARKKAPRQSTHYLAFILPSKQLDQVRMIDLGLAEDIDHLIQNFRESVIPGKQKNTGGLLDFGDWDDALVLEIMKSNPAAGIKLREAIFEPIRPYLGEMKSLILAPDGALNLIPFQVLPIDETGKQLLMDKYTISYLSVGRDILRSKVQQTRPASAPLVIADPDFDLAAEQSAESHTTNPPPTTLDILNTLGGDRRFERMSGTRFLGESVAKKLKEVRLYLEAEAVESHLATCQSPSILLIATHGIFFSDAQDKPPTQELTLSRLDLLSKGKIENPMMRSGLALAGANTWLANGSLPKEAGKGFVFAQDVAGLDLWANEITVLSACNTAMGDIKIGEGVFGLRRAFAVAGAKTLVMSLWPVPDKATALLMERFFDNCDRGLGRAEALQEAQNYLRTITVKELRQSSLGLEVLKDLLGVKELDSQVSISCQENDTPLEHPFYWGAWICQGDTTPLPFTACS